MSIFDMVMPVLQLIANGERATMAVFTAYINDELGYDIFCEDMPLDLFHILQGDIKDSLVLRDALKDSGVLQKGLEIYIDKAFEDCHMLYHFMDGESTILNDPVLYGLLSNGDRRILEDLFKSWDDGTICDENWEDILTEMCTERASK